MYYKNLLIAVITTLLSVSITYGQSSFEKSSKIINIGIGLGMDDRNYGRYASVFEPNFLASFEMGVHDYVSVGGYFGMYTFKYGSSSSSRGFVFDFGAKGSFHWWKLLDEKVKKDLKQSQFDLYVTIYLGLEMGKRNRDYSYYGNYRRNNFEYGATIGLRWYPKNNERFSLMTELGSNPISFVLIGASIKM